MLVVLMTWFRFFGSFIGLFRVLKAWIYVFVGMSVMSSVVRVSVVSSVMRMTVCISQARTASRQHKQPGQKLQIHHFN